jgi:molybdopterin converting factor subunit 1
MSDAAVRRIAVEYYAQLREQAGCSHETVDTGAADLAQLYAELQRRHGFTLPQSMLKVAVNAAFVDWQQPLRDGDTVVFVPPVAGG